MSSTYVDLRAERQAAVEAILTAGHIPAGMELFTAGDQSQMDVIKHWIEESDVFLLILGGRYGSLEPLSGKSYIQLEYEHAIALKKPLFAVVIEDEHLDERSRQRGPDVIEKDNPQLLEEFKAVVLSRLVRFWRDPRDIKLSVLETLAAFDRRSELIGWIPGDHATDTTPLTDEIARLAKENASLREQFANALEADVLPRAISYRAVYRLLAETPAALSDSALKDLLASSDFEVALKAILDVLGNRNAGPPTLLHLFWGLRRVLRLGDTLDGRYRETLDQIEGLGLIQKERTFFTLSYRLSDVGLAFLSRLEEKIPNDAHAYRLPYEPGRS